MENQKDEPADECEQARGKSNQHEPTHHTERINKLAIIVSVNDAWMRRAFVYLAPVRVRDRGAQHDRSYWGKRERHDEGKRQ